MSWTKWNGDALLFVTEDAISKGVHEAAEAIGSISDQQVPHDEGWLQESKRITEHPSEKTTVSISYGGGVGTDIPRVPYALKWHFTDANFQKGRKSFYLQDPVFKNGPRITQRALVNRLKVVW